MHPLITRASGGIVRTRLLIDGGVGRSEIARAVAAGAVTRVGKGWVALPDADPEMLFAVRHGLTLSCMTRLRRAGVWVHDPRIPHFSVPRPGAERRPARAVLHYHRPVLPREPFALEESIDNALVLAAQCQPFEHAVATWDSAFNKRLASRALLAQLPLNGRARAVLAATDPFADSGLESYARERLKRFGLEIVAQAYILGHHVDLLIGERLVLQTDGATHTGKQRDRDNAHDALLDLHGYTVIRIGYDTVMREWPAAQALIMQAVAQGKHLAR